MVLFSITKPSLSFLDSFCNSSKIITERQNRVTKL